jgi:hypothetical protein
VLDPVFWALELGAPTQVMAEADEYADPRVRAETFPPGSLIRYEFPERGSKPPVVVSWYDGRRRPPRPPELEPNRQLPGIGALVIGDQGKILYGSHGAGGAKLIPEARWRTYQRPARTLARAPGHHEDWINACKKGGQAGSHFGYGGPLTEIALLGVIALRFPGRKLAWDTRLLQITNDREANAWVTPPRRKGWEI